jgi:uncharacterized membrane protein
MTQAVSSWLEAVIRWTHVLTGLGWIGAMYLFDLVDVHGRQVAEAGKGTAPPLVPRALSWCRWAAAGAWVSGILLLGIFYYGGEELVRREVRLVTQHGLTMDFIRATNEPVISHGTGVILALVAIVMSCVAYESVLKVLGRHEWMAAAVSIALFSLALALLSRVFTARAVFIHAGVLLGSIMAMNVWVHIWPAQRRLMQRVSGGAAAPGGLVALRAEHNVYMAAPLTFAMISNHYPTIYDSEHGWAIMALVVLVAWAVSRLSRGGVPSRDRG